jgi:hypothetical protein
VKLGGSGDGNEDIGQQAAAALEDIKKTYDRHYQQAAAIER